LDLNQRPPGRGTGIVFSLWVSCISSRKGGIRPALTSNIPLATICGNVHIPDIQVIIMRAFVKSFKALSDETRLRILNILLERECCVCEVMQALDISQTRASRNLAVLHEAGFLKLRKDGLWSLYSIDTDDMNEYLADLVQAVTKALKENKTLEQDRQRLRKAERVGLRCAEKMRGKETIA